MSFLDDLGKCRDVGLEARIEAPSTRTELKRELARLGHYNGPIVWDDTARAAVAAYLDAPR